MLIDLDGTYYGPLVVTKNTAGTPTAPTGSVAFAIYGPNPTAPMSSGTGTLTGGVETDNTAPCYGALFKGPGTAVSAANGYVAGQTYTRIVTYTVSAVVHVDESTFTVV